MENPVDGGGCREFTHEHDVIVIGGVAGCVRHRGLARSLGGSHLQSLLGRPKPSGPREAGGGVPTWMTRLLEGSIRHTCGGASTSQMAHCRASRAGGPAACANWRGGARSRFSQQGREDLSATSGDTAMRWPTSAIEPAWKCPHVQEHGVLGNKVHMEHTVPRCEGRDRVSARFGYDRESGYHVCSGRGRSCWPPRIGRAYKITQQGIHGDGHSCVYRRPPTDGPGVRSVSSNRNGLAASVRGIW